MTSTPKRHYRLTASLLAATLLLGASMPAQAVFCANCSTEWTQIIHMLETLMLEINQGTQLVNEGKHLAQLPQTMIDQETLPYRTLLGEVQKLRTSVTNLRDTTRSARATVQRRYDEMRRLNMAPVDYWQAEADLAQSQHGIYQQQLDDDMASLKNAEDSSKAFEQMYGQIGTISGDVQGLQTLAQYDHAMTGQLSQMNQLIHRQVIAAAEEKNNTDIKTTADRQAMIEAYKADKARADAMAADAHDLSISLPSLVK